MSANAPPSPYEQIDLGTLHGGSSWPRAINSAGDVVGESDGHAFLWHNRTMIDLGTLGGSRSEARDLNNAGEVTGWSTTASGETHAFIWQGGVMQDLGPFQNVGATVFDYNGTSPYRTPQYGPVINEAGEVAWTAPVAQNVTHAFLFRGGVVTDLGTLAGGSSSAWAINNHGDVAGLSDGPDPSGRDTRTNLSHLVVWSGDGVRDLAFVGAPPFGPQVTGFDDSGEIAVIADLRPDLNGSGFIEAPFSPHALLWAGGQLHALTSTSFEKAEAVAMTENGFIVGTNCSCESDGSSQPFVWSAGVETPLTSIGGGNFQRLEAVNAAGTAVGWYTYRYQDEPGALFHATVWTNGTATDLDADTSANESSQARAINSRGDVVGFTGPWFRQRATLWRRHGGN